MVGNPSADDRLDWVSSLFGWFHAGAKRTANTHTHERTSSLADLTYARASRRRCGGCAANLRRRTAWRPGRCKPHHDGASFEHRSSSLEIRSPTLLAVVRPSARVLKTVRHEVSVLYPAAVRLNSNCYQ